MKKSIISLFLILISGLTAPSFAQHHDPAPPATLGDRVAVMDFVFPEHLEPSTDFTLSMILFDHTNNKKFEHVSVQLAIFKEGVKNPLMNVLFYDKNGEIVIDFKNKSYEKENTAIIQAAQETYLGGYMGEFGSHIKVLQNIFSENGMYTLEAKVVSIDNPKQFIENQITFTKTIHVGTHASNPVISIPDWVRNNAKWWSEGQIEDKDFASGIQFMIKQGIIKIPTDSTDQNGQDVKIPDWVRNNAKWWSEGQIEDKDFASGIQHLVKLGIIRV